MSAAKNNCTTHHFMQRDTVCSHYSHSTNNLVVIEPTYICNLLIQLPVSTPRTSLLRIRNNPWSMPLKYWWMNVCACGQTQKCTYTSVSTGQWNLQAKGSTITIPILVVKYVRVGKTECNERNSSFPVGTSAVSKLIQCVSSLLQRRNTMVDVLLLFIKSISWTIYVCRAAEMQTCLKE